MPRCIVQGGPSKGGCRASTSEVFGCKPSPLSSQAIKLQAQHEEVIRRPNVRFDMGGQVLDEIGDRTESYCLALVETLALAHVFPLQFPEIELGAGQMIGYE